MNGSSTKDSRGTFINGTCAENVLCIIKWQSTTQKQGGQTKCILMGNCNDELFYAEYHAKHLKQEK